MTDGLEQFLVGLLGGFLIGLMLPIAAGWWVL